MFEPIFIKYLLDSMPLKNTWLLLGDQTLFDKRKNSNPFTLVSR